MHSLQVKETLRKTNTPLDSHRANPLALAYFSHIAYHRLDRIERTLLRDGALSVVLYNRNDTQGFLVEFDNCYVLSFRGTETKKWRDLVTDFSIWLVKYRGMLVHSGFLTAFRSVEKELGRDLQKAVQSKKRIFYTGHSLGGALAMLACSLVKPDSMYTFGCPKLGKFGRDYLYGIDVIQYQHYEDWVPHLPPYITPSRSSGPTQKYWAGSWSPFVAHSMFSYMKTLAEHENCPDGVEPANNLYSVIDLK
jgi:hypothetical protein